MKKIFTSIQRQVVVQQSWDYNLQALEDEYRLYSCDVTLVNIPVLVDIRKAIQSNKTTAIPEGSKVYFSKSSTFSRLKFRGWASKYKCTVTRSIEKADIIVIDIKLYNTLITNLVERNFHIGGVQGEYGSFRYDRRFHRKYKGKLTYPGNIVKLQTLNYGMTISDKEGIEEMSKFSYVNGKFITSKSLADLVFTESMGDVEYNTIHDMFSSGNSDDIELAVEIMSNFNWIGSAYHITKLFYNFNRIIDMSSNVNSVTFAHLKGLFVDYTRIHRNTTSEFRNIFGFLVSKGRESLVEDEYIIDSLRYEVQADVDKLCTTLGTLTNIKLLDLNVKFETPSSSKTFRITF